eukprot:CAMPEP_0176065292 /NCGR_PEP_ID=MMETSP0120_2-20121206/32573_1 /TAXON_ID=160619 /ORGANISM="Kryptoperidinium foliaceum, Strain CCMP 1326" /LENGTH=233 /DNA_ID=CAMNT_0017398879 /DNA_START=37 /DNA_END=737 /DNA_ORIENTATION=+
MARSLGCLPQAIRSRSPMGADWFRSPAPRWVQDRETELERLRKEGEELRSQGERLRDRNHQLEAELSECRRKNQAQLEENRNVAQQVMSLRTQLGKLGKLRDRLESAFVGEDADPAAYGADYGHGGMVTNSSYGGIPTEPSARASGNRGATWLTSHRWQTSGSSTRPRALPAPRVAVRPVEDRALRHESLAASPRRRPACCSKARSPMTWPGAPFGSPALWRLAALGVGAFDI